MPYKKTHLIRNPEKKLAKNKKKFMNENTNHFHKTHSTITQKLPKKINSLRVIIIFSFNNKQVI